MTKKIFYVVAVAATLAACNQNTPDNPTEQNTPDNPTEQNTPDNPTEQNDGAFTKATYFEALGKNTVPNVEGENKDQPFRLDNVRVEAKILTDTTLDICLYGINFSSKMPVTIDMVIPSARYTRKADSIAISGENIAPTMGGNPFNKYMITGLSGFITADSLVFTNNYGTYAGCSYVGKITKME